MKSVPVPGHGPDVSCHPRIVTQGAAYFGHEVVQAGVGHEGVRPQMLQQFGLADCLRPPIQQELQELKGPGRKRLNASMAKKHAPPGIELAIAEHEVHARLGRN